MASESGRPRMVVHASISIDGAMTGFQPDMPAHYEAAAAIPAQARLTGSKTMASGLEEFGADESAPETGPKDDDPSLPYWVVVDSTGMLQGRLQAVRAFPAVREVIVLTSEATPDSYLQYLADNGYPYLSVGWSQVDLKTSLKRLQEHWGVTDIVVDAGPTLTSVLLAANLVDEVSLLVHPIVAGASGRRLFARVQAKQSISLLSASALDSGLVSIRYSVGPSPFSS